jgi:hypothetical protein
MVRAAVSGAIDYSRADPTNINWRLKQKLVLYEVQRQENAKLLECIHQHWLAYISHGNLTADSFSDVKNHANKVLDSLQAAILPWSVKQETEVKNDTINGGPVLDAETQKLVDNYKKMVGMTD